MSVKKYFMQVQKNQSTSQDDILIKPDPTKVSGMKHGSYDKLNDKGYVEEEVVIEYGDVIFGKITPVSDSTGTGKPYRDTSEIYKVGAPGVVDRMYLDTSNQDGYEIRKCCVRSERIPKIGDKYCCYDDQTELLTESGWKFFKDLQLTDKVATLVNGDTLEYRGITDKYEYDHDGEMYQVKSNQVDLLVTTNHRMYVNNRDTKGYTIKEAKDILNKCVYYKKNAEKYNPLTQNKYINGNKFILPAYKNEKEKEIDLDAWLVFLGIWYVEGCIKSNCEVSITAYKQRVNDTLTEINKILDFKHHIQKNNGEEKDNIWLYSDSILLNYVSSLSIEATNKQLPEWVWSLKQEQCRKLLNGMMLGDGHQIEGSCTCRYDTSSKLLANDFQRLCLHAGYASNLSLKYEAGHQSTVKNGEIITSTTDAYRLSVITKQVKPLVNNNKGDNKLLDSLTNYKGKVYCCTVREDKNNRSDGTLYVRRNGIPVWSCNSQHGQKGTIGILMDDIDMPFNKYGLKPDIIVNPHAIPSRMTVGQLAECLVGKAASLNGMDADGTQFEDYDFSSVEEMLTKMGYDPKGNEYLYNGMTGEKMLVKYFFGPTYYQRLKHLVHDKIHCLSMDHEVLTENGWKKYEEMKDGEKVATLKDGKLVYDTAKLLYFPNYKGKMYKIETSQINLNVTDNHRMWVSSPHNNKYRHVMAKDLVGKFIKYKKDAEWDAQDYQFILPGVMKDNNEADYEDKVVDMNAWLTFFGIWIAEGFASIIQDKSKEYNSFQYRVEVSIDKQRVKDVLYPAFDKLGYKYNVYNEKTTFCNKQLCMYLKPFSNGAPNKYLPDWVWKLSKNQAKKLLDALILGDGSFNGNSIRYYTSSKKLRDDIMRLSLHAGLSASYSLKEEAGTKTIIRGGDCIKTCDHYCIDINQTRNNPTANKKYEGKTTGDNGDNNEQLYDYEGPVFCLEVPSEVFYVRREGIPVWTGNSRARGLKASLTRQKSLQQGYHRRVTGRRGLARVQIESRIDVTRWNYLGGIIVGLLIISK